MKNGNITMSIVINGPNGDHDAREYLASTGDTYVEGREGSNFALRLHNGSGRRALLVPSVDGLSVMDGKPAGRSSGGFILDAGETLSVPGWLVDGTTAAKFVFAGMKDGVDESYVARIGGDVANKGVIGVIAYGERNPIPQHSKGVLRGMGLSPSGFGSSSMMASASLASASNSAQMKVSPQGAPSLDLEEQTLGTGFGKSTDFRTRRVNFDRGSEIARMELCYDDAKGLRRLGIDIERPLRTRPKAFPADTYCPKPAGWEG